MNQPTDYHKLQMKMINFEVLHQRAVAKLNEIKAMIEEEFYEHKKNFLQYKVPLLQQDGVSPNEIYEIYVKESEDIQLKHMGWYEEFRNTYMNK